MAVWHRAALSARTIDDLSVPVMPAFSPALYPVNNIYVAFEYIFRPFLCGLTANLAFTR